MAFLQCSIHSDVLGKACGINVILPQKVNTQIGMGSTAAAGELPVLYLLHGLSDDQTIWCRRTSIERYASAYNVAVVMPDGGRGWYTDAVIGDKYWSYLADELPQIVRALFHISSDPAKTFAAGLSMGGYGALKLALRQPDKFAGAAGLSSVTDMCAKIKTAHWGEAFLRIFESPERAIKDGNDLFTLAEKAVKAPHPPKILQVCGTEDYLFADNERFHQHMENLHYPNYEYVTAPGNHNWEFWDEHIQYALRFLLK